MTNWFEPPFEDLQYNDVPRNSLVLFYGTIKAYSIFGNTGTIDYGEFRVNGGAWVTTGFVGPNDTVEVRHTSSESFETAKTSTIDWGGGSTDTITSVTEARDAAPDLYTYPAVTNANPGQVYETGLKAVTGMNAASTINDLVGSAAGFAEISVNGGGWSSSAPSYIYPGDYIKLRITASSTLGASRTISVSFEGGATVTHNFTVTTRSPDITPSAFSFTDQTGATPSTLRTSNSVTISGMDAGYDSPVTFPTKTNATVQSPATYAYEVNINGGGWQEATGTLNIRNGQTIQLRMGSPSAAEGVANFAASINGVQDIFTVTNAADSTSPDPFTFNDVASVAAGEQVSSNVVTITGITVAVTASFTTSGGSGHQYRKNGGAWTDVANVSVSAGDTIQLRMTVPGTAGQSGNITMSVGTNPGESNQWSATAAAPDTAPDTFTFDPVTGVDENAVVGSNAITVGGLNTYQSGTSISVSGGEYRINGGAWTSATGTVYNGDAVEARLTAAAQRSTTVIATVTIGGVPGEFRVTTRTPNKNSQYVATFRDARYGVAI